MNSVKEKKQDNTNVFSKMDNDMKNPCILEHRLALRCLDERGYNKDQCGIFFTNYKNCKTFWDRIVKDRKRKGIKPYLPPPTERQTIKDSHEQKAKVDSGK
ncbi:DgyrCDS11076 [Dimorphilus gyrociliatus]|uniref:Coiled-coil-helix-coiled-coil-helix domain-containing protein 7 n=1 Tax=Dimorphilus gyrociliatus TaxID=2664684 RepID=A0A7I8W286_9ANNE|nr:DgyrCDS11076 [Dimorphilus gyrociliatus]